MRKVSRGSTGLSWKWKLFALALCAGAAGNGLGASGSDIVVVASDVATHGNWSKASDGTAAGGQYLQTPDAGWSQLDAPLAAPANYFEATVSAPASTPYRIWLRLRAGSNSKWNDSVWVQFSDSVASNGAADHRIGSTSALLVNLERCKDCGVSGWGWQNGAYWLAQDTAVRFAGSGAHTIRVQTREDGVQIDQIVLSPDTYASSAPGSVLNDATIVGGASASTSASSSGLSPYFGTPISLPGTVYAVNFDNGGSGVAYRDTTSGNTGGQYRLTDVDIEASGGGSYDVGWISAGEWLNYTVNVGSAGSYTAVLRVASPYGGSLHLGFNGPSNVWKSVSVPKTGGWQAWTTVNVPVTLGAGTQQITLSFDTSGFNVSSIAVTGGSGGGSGGGSTTSSPYSGSPAAVPGTIQAEKFDNGAGAGYHDSTAGNTGGAFRQTDVDIQTTSGGYNVGWIAGGEWLNYTVVVAAAGSYTANLRVASPGGGSLHLGFNGASNVWKSVSVPATGGWQTWTNVAVPVTLGAGVQQMTLAFDTSGFNVDSIDVTSGSSTSGGGGSGGGSPSDVTVVTWNLHVDSSAAHARSVMDQIAAMNPQPQIVIVEEASRSVYQTYIDELQARTGKTWQGAFQTHCPSGAWNGSSCTRTEDEGVGVFTSFRIVDSSSKYLPYADAWHSARASVRAAIDVGGIVVQAFAVHLQPNDATARRNSIAVFKTWSGAYSKPQIVGGDFNAVPSEVDTSTNMGSAFVDVWSLVGGWSGFTAFTPSASMKIDFSFADLSGKALPTWSNVVTSTGTISDHFPVITTFTVRP